MYLVDALRYNVPAFHEDRLTQIIAATFNESVFFRKELLKFFGVPYKSNLAARTQVTNNIGSSRPDLIIFHAERPYIVFESKIDAPSDRLQQFRHKNIKCDYYILVVRDPTHESLVERSFRIKTWFDLFSHIQTTAEKAPSEIDKFICRKLIEYAKESGLLLPDRISVGDFQSACALLTEIRLRKNPNLAFEKENPFKALDNISMFLMRSILRIKEDQLIGPHLRQFTKRIRVGNLIYERDKNLINKMTSKGERLELTLKTEIVILEKEIRLKRPISRYEFIYVRACFVPYYKQNEINELSSNVVKTIQLEKINYRCEVTAGMTETGGSSSDSFAYSDEEAVGFDEFMRDARSGWARRLKLR